MKSQKIQMKRQKVRLTVDAELFAVDEDDVMETLQSTFAHRLPHLIDAQLVTVEFRTS